MTEAHDHVYAHIRAHFPELSAKTDARYMRYEAIGDDFEAEEEIFTYLWLERLADILNFEMTAGVDVEKLTPVFEALVDMLDWNAETLKCIDVAVVENLFYQVKPAAAEPYWNVFPGRLQALYLRFFGRPPTDPSRTFIETDEFVPLYVPRGLP